jgi:hypothetical protein
MQLCDYVIRAMMSCCAVDEYYTSKWCGTCPGAWRAACGKTTQQCCEGCDLATNRDVNAVTNILNASLRSLFNTGQRPEDLRRPEPNKPGEDAADDTGSEDADEDSEDSEDDDDSSDDSDSQGKREVHLVAPTLPLSMLRCGRSG